MQNSLSLDKLAEEPIKKKDFNSDNESLYQQKIKNIYDGMDIFVENSRSFRNLLNTSKGRDKFC